jgi:hypothetical protein
MVKLPNMVGAHQGAIYMLTYIYFMPGIATIRPNLSILRVCLRPRLE